MDRFAGRLPTRIKARQRPVGAGLSLAIGEDHVIRARTAKEAL
jgi:hypothetical protein